MFFRLIQLCCFHPETPDVKLLVFNSETRDLLSWQANPRIDTARAKNNRFRMKTMYITFAQQDKTFYQKV